MSNSKDPKGYYACLGVPTNASSDEIKAAYKQIAKKLHPDVNRAANANSQFQKVSEAYLVLSNPNSRSEYDASQFSEPKPNPAKDELDPICCSHCGKVTAQPRSTVFYRVVSLVLLSMKTPIQGIFCSSCAKKIGLKASLVSGLFGWWGFPWGPIWTIGAIFTNASGGRYTSDIDERLTWYNTLAFLSRGNFAISYALAQQSLRAKNSEIALSAAKLIDHLRTLGVPATSPALKNPWSNPLLSATHIALLLLIPGVVGLAFAYDELSRGSSYARPTSAYTPPARQAYSPAPPPYSRPDFINNATTAPAPSTPPPPTCANPPLNSHILVRNIATAADGHLLEIKNGSAANAIIKLRDANTNRLKLSFYVARGNAASISNLPDGNYRIQYAFGDELGIDCRTFINVTAASEFPDPRVLTTEYTNTQIITRRLSYTLYSVPGGNVRPRTIGAAAFAAD